MKLVHSFFYLFFFPLLLVLPTVNILLYIGLPTLSHLTLSNISLVLFFLFSFTYKKINLRIIYLILMFFTFLIYSMFISFLTLSQGSILRGSVEFVYFILIILLLFSIDKTIRHHVANNSLIISSMLRNIGFFALTLFFLITLYQYLFSSSPSFLLANLNIGYRDFRNPILEGATNYKVFRAIGTFPEASMYAGFIACLMPMMKFKNNFMNLIIFLLVVVSIMLTYSRIGILLILIYFLLLFFLSDKKTMYMFSMIFFLSLLTILDLFLLDGELLVANVIRVLDMTSNIDVSIITRIFTPLSVIEILDWQIIIGYGLGSIVDLISLLNLSSEYMHFDTPRLNNFYLFLFIQFGVVIFLIFSIFLFIFIRKIIKMNIHRINSNEFKSFIMCLFYFFTLDHLNLFYMFFIVFTLGLFLYYKTIYS